MSGAVAHLVCDCDGVLLDSEAAAQHALQTQLAARLPGVDAAAVIQPRLGMTLEALLADIAGQHPLPLAPDEIARIRRAVDAEVAARLRAVPGVAAALRAIPLPKAVASNSAGARVRAALRRTGLWPLFQGRVHCADEVGAAKPAPDVYLAACRSLRAAPDDCLA
ncbi:HAD family hydrolase, partial [Chromobacterium haemolyticum]